MSKKQAKDFGKKEKVLNFASNNYQLTRPRKVGAVMELIRECQPKSLRDWEKFYFKKAFSKRKNPYKMTPQILDELGERLFAKITEIVIPDWTSAFNDLTEQDCRDYIYEVTLVRTFDGFLTEKSVVNDKLAKQFPKVVFEESDSELDHSGDVDYLGKVGDKAFGLQIKPITANANFGNYKPTDRMKSHFEDFKKIYGGNVFVVFSKREGDKKQIENEKELLNEIETEIKRLEELQNEL
jgi:hypothetical protein